MTIMLAPHGFCLLTTQSDKTPNERLYFSLLKAGFGPWDNNGLPLFVVLDNHGTKTQWFEAGCMVGRKVPLYFVGKGVRFRNRHRSLIDRMGGYAVTMEANELIPAIARHGIVPTAWDKEACAAAMARAVSKPATIASRGELLSDYARLLNQHGPDSHEAADFLEANQADKEFVELAELSRTLKKALTLT